LKNILVVDDHINILRLLSEELLDQGYQVMEANNGKEALAKLTEKKCDLVIMDIIMPQMNGFDAIREMRKFSRVPVIACSFDAHNKDMALKLGADHFTIKPYDIDDLLGSIDLLLKQPAC
jgi:DNA-binding response OmpR family regulator